MKKVLCALLICAICTTTAIGFSGCGCNRNSVSNNTPGYVVEPTKPDLNDGDFGFFIINSDKLMVSKYTGKDSDVVIPSTYKNYTVTVVGRSIFNGNDDIKTVTMPDTITEIQDYSFSSCHNLEKVTFSKNTKVLGNSTFFNCPNLKSIELPDSIEEMGAHTFSGIGAESVTIPQSEVFTSLGEFAFYQCQQLKEVTIPETVTNIPENAFSDCPNKITIKGKTGSYAEDYAGKYNFTFEQLN